MSKQHDATYGGTIDFENDSEMLDITLHNLAAHLTRQGYTDTARAVTCAARKLSVPSETRHTHGGRPMTLQECADAEAPPSAPINNDLTRLIDKMHDCVIDASSGPVGNLMDAWMELKEKIEPSAPSATRRLADEMVPLLEVLKVPCKGCGKTPLEFIEGEASDQSAR